MNFVQVYPKKILSYSERTELFETFNDGVLSKGLNFRLKLLNEFVFCSFFFSSSFFFFFFFFFLGRSLFYIDFSFFFFFFFFYKHSA